MAINTLRNKDMRISKVLGKQDIQSQKQDIEIPDAVKLKGRAHIEKSIAALGYDTIFGRTDAMRLLRLTASPASELLKKLLQLGLIEAVTGKGKGKYVFRQR